MFYNLVVFYAYDVFLYEIGPLLRFADAPPLMSEPFFHKPCLEPFDIHFGIILGFGPPMITSFHLEGAASLETHLMCNYKY